MGVFPPILGLILFLDLAGEDFRLILSFFVGENLALSLDEFFLLDCLEIYLPTAKISKFSL